MTCTVTCKSLNSVFFIIFILSSLALGDNPAVWLFQIATLTYRWPSVLKESDSCNSYQLPDGYMLMSLTLKNVV